MYEPEHRGWAILKTTGAIFQWFFGVVTLVFLILYLVVGLIAKYETGTFDAQGSLAIAFEITLNCAAWLISALSYLGTFQGIVLVLLISIFLFVTDVARTRQRSRY
jgi:uncharacterized Tic20 family protein